MKSLPWAEIVCVLALLSGSGLAVYGVFVLAGLGWALLAGSLPCFLLSAIILRGVLRG